MAFQAGITSLCSGGGGGGGGDGGSGGGVWQGVTS